jgi:hypothetical protein
LQERSSNRPFALGGGRRDVQHRGGFLDAEAAEEPKLDELALVRIEPFEALECLVHRFEIDFLRRSCRGRFVRFEAGFKVDPLAVRWSVCSPRSRLRCRRARTRNSS